MRILYIMGDCGSGIEQIGYVYLLLLKKLGHNVDAVITQDIPALKKFQSAIKNYDAVVFNEPNPNHIALFDIPREKKVFYIVHSEPPSNSPLSVIMLSLNYHYHYRISKVKNIMYPLTYPFAYNGEFDYNNNRKYSFGFVGRLNDNKFIPEFKQYLKKTNKVIDYCITSTICNGNDWPCVDMEYDWNIEDIYTRYMLTNFLVLPSTTECFSLVVGEALSMGCVPIVLDSQYGEHEQFKYCLVAHSVDEFIALFENVEIDHVYSKKAMDWMREIYSLPRCIYDFEQHFGKERKTGKVTLANIFDFSRRRPYINAATITGEEIITNA